MHWHESGARFDVLSLVLLFFELDDERADGGCLGGVWENAEEFFVGSYRFGVFFLAFVDEAEELVDDHRIRGTGKLFDG